MLYLPEPNKVDLNKYFESLKSSLIKRVNDPRIGQVLRLHLNEHKLKQIITEPPDQLKQHHSDVLRLYLTIDELARFDWYIDNRGKEHDSQADQDLIEKYNLAYDQIKSIFNYDYLFGKKRNIAYELAELLGRNTCTYCNRLYTNTVRVKNPRSGKVIYDLMRPQFDHWFSKSNYPTLALSFYNLIPSCSVCNSSIKHNADFQLDTHVHPYRKVVSDQYTFSFYCKGLNRNNVRIRDIGGDKTAHTLSDLKMEEVYNAHSALELKDLLELRYKYSNNYLEILLNKTFRNLGLGKREACRLIFGIEIDEESFHKRPLSKFKRDILKELGVKF